MRAVWGVAVVAAVLVAGCGDGAAPADRTEPFRVGRAFRFDPAPRAPAVGPQIAYTGGYIADRSRGTYIVVADLAGGRRRVVARSPGVYGSQSGFSFAGVVAGRSGPGVCRQSRPSLPDRDWHRGARMDQRDLRSRQRRARATATARLAPRDHRAGETFGPVWSPDGRGVIARGRHGRTLIPIKPRRGRAATGGVSYGAYSPDGRLLVLEYAGGLRIVDVHTRTVRTTVTNGAQPSWSPDSHRLVFVTNRDHHGDVSQGESGVDEGAADEIYITDADGRHQQRVTNTDVSESGPRWSPDGRLILYDVQSGAGILSDTQGALNVIRPNGSCTTTLPVPTSTDIAPNSYQWRPGSDTSQIKLNCRSAAPLPAP